jgi:L-seryl-tRNA(Ser) seleniumtransferase
MAGQGFGVSRRGFLAGLGAASLSGGLEATAAPVQGAGGVYAGLGVRPLINAAGTYTALSGSLLLPEVRAAMDEASRSYVSLPELHEACGNRIASLIGAEAALVTSGCAAALTLATAACVCGEDEDAIQRVPDTEGLKNEVVFLKEQRFGYDHAIRNVGVTIVEVESQSEMRSAINERTAMLFYLNHANDRSPMTRDEVAALGRQTGVPTLIDAAADLPPAKNLSAYLELGYDLVAFSGGKGLRGPQCSGFLAGRRDLIRAAYANGAPSSNTVARIAKVGKEEIVGLTRAVELYLERDHEAEWNEWEARVRHILSAVDGIAGVSGERFVPEIANAVPHAAIEWDRRRIELTREDFVEALRLGEPRIEVRPSDPGEPRLEIGVWMMEPDEHRIVATRCAELLRAAAG